MAFLSFPKKIEMGSQNVLSCPPEPPDYRPGGAFLPGKETLYLYGKYSLWFSHASFPGLLPTFATDEEGLLRSETPQDTLFPSARLVALLPKNLSFLHNDNKGHKS